MLANSSEAPEAPVRARMSFGVLPGTAGFFVGTTVSVVVSALSIAAFANGLDSRTTDGSSALVVTYLNDIPGLPLFLVLELLGAIPGGEDDDLIRGIILTGCAAPMWGLIAGSSAWLGSRLTELARKKDASSNDEASGLIDFRRHRY